jgi:glycosyltransferase involved in cell wall biosynthesis
MLRSRCTTVVAIDEGVRSSLPRGVASIVIRNGFAQGLEAGAPQIPGGPTSRGIFRAAMVGSLSAMKGVYEFIEAARMLSQKGLDIEYLLVGDEIRPLAGPRGWLLRALNFARPVRRELEARIAAFGLQDRVRLLGFTVEIRAIYDAIDVLCFPSHLDAPGRPVFEAAFCGVPSIVAMTKSYPDTFVAGETGLQIPPRDPAALAHAIETLFRDATLRQRMGEQARALAMRNFDIRSNASDMLALYRQVAARSEPWNEA